MNKERRKQINELCNKLRDLSEDLNCILSDEQDCFDSMPENLQGSEKGCASEEAIESLEEASEQLDDVIESLENIV